MSSDRTCPVCDEPVSNPIRTYCSKSCSVRARGSTFRGVVCSVDDCTRPLHANGYCEMHARRVKVHGSPDVKLTRQGMPLEERFWQNVNKLGPNDCWEWTGERHDFGYGRFATYENNKRHRHLAHRYVLELTGQVLIPGLVVMHSCDNPPCVNPAHLSQAPQSENIRDAYRKGRMDTTGLALRWGRGAA